VTAERARELLGTITGVTAAAGAAPVVAQVPPEQWEAAARLTKDALGCTFFSFLTAVDWKADGPRSRGVGGESRGAARGAAAHEAGRRQR
jgi:hypothetical protein